MAGELIEDPILTADDFVRAGACRSGVIAAIRRLAARVAAAMPASQLLRLVSKDERRWVLRAAGLDGYGDGYGDGDGDGYGYGYGDGDGYGDGYGYGYGYGDGDGYDTD